MGVEIPRYLREAVLRQYEVKKAELWRELRALTEMTPEAFVAAYGLSFDENDPEWLKVLRVAAARFPGYGVDAESVESISYSFDAGSLPKLYVGFKNGAPGRYGGVEGKCSTSELELRDDDEEEKHHG